MKPEQMVLYCYGVLNHQAIFILWSVWFSTFVQAKKWPFSFVLHYSCCLRLFFRLPLIFTCPVSLCSLLGQESFEMTVAIVGKFLLHLQDKKKKNPVEKK